MFLLMHLAVSQIMQAGWQSPATWSVEVRVITDKLDSVGNTTAAIGKGFAIGSAAFATVSLIVAYVGNYTANGEEPVLNISLPLSLLQVD